MSAEGLASANHTQRAYAAYSHLRFFVIDHKVQLLAQTHSMSFSYGLGQAYLEGRTAS
jgi:hypothetical protein